MATDYYASSICHEIGHCAGFALSGATSMTITGDGTGYRALCDNIDEHTPAQKALDAAIASCAGNAYELMSGLVKDQGLPLPVATEAVRQGYLQNGSIALEIRLGLGCKVTSKSDLEAMAAVKFTDLTPALTVGGRIASVLFMNPEWMKAACAAVESGESVLLNNAAIIGLLDRGEVPALRVGSSESWLAMGIVIGAASCPLHALAGKLLNA